jgi:hypothetical protein
VLRDQGPVTALDELATDMERPVRLTGEIGRLDWEIESGIYYLTAAAMHLLGGRPAAQELVVHLEHCAGRLSVHIEDPAPDVPAQQVRDALADDAERLAALGGGLELSEAGAARGEWTASPRGSGSAPASGTITVRAWLPDRLQPQVRIAAVEAPAR